MACCVLMAALLGSAALINSLLTLTLHGQPAAQDWRLPHRKDEHG